MTSRPLLNALCHSNIYVRENLEWMEVKLYTNIKKVVSNFTVSVCASSLNETIRIKLDELSCVSLCTNRRIIHICKPSSMNLQLCYDIRINRKSFVVEHGSLLRSCCTIGLFTCSRIERYTYIFPMK